ncbi:MAG: hypothetical protein ACK5YM_12150, partial [Pseudomonadota bacterium]
ERGSAQGLVAAWQRRLDEPALRGQAATREHTVTLVNFGDAAAEAQVEGLPPGARLLSRHPAGGAVAARADAQGRARVTLGPLSVRVLEVAAARTR